MHESDLELTRQVAQGNKKASEEMVGRLFELVRSACRYSAGNSNDWEDMAQIAMMEILKSAGSYKGESPLEKWAGTITMRTIWRKIRKKQRYISILQVVFRSHDEDPVSQSLEVDVDGQTLRSRMSVLLGKISPEQRMALVMKFGFGYSVREISETLLTSENTIKDRLKRGKEKLKRLALNDKVLKEFVEKIEK